MFRTDKEELTIEEIQEYIKVHSTEAVKYKRLQDYYLGKHDILKEEKDPGIPNNKIVNPFPRYITDMLVGYFVGQPISYISKDNSNKLLEQIQPIFDYSDEQEENLELAKMCSIKGKALELLYRDEEANIRFNEIDPTEMFVIYDNKIAPAIKFAVRYYDIGEGNNKTTVIELYDVEKVTVYKSASDGYVQDSVTPHTFKDVPVIEYLNNKEEQGDFEQVISLIDAYNKSQSNTLNDMEQFTDAYLILINLLGTDDDDLKSAKDRKVFMMDDEGDAKWLTKSVNDTWYENYKNRLKKDIHKFSYTPDMQDEDFGSNLSGVAIRYKILAMEQIRSNKERKFKKGLQRRIELICNSLSIQKDLDTFTDINIKFSNTLPQNVFELSQTIQNLQPILSKETLLSLLPFVESASEELAKKEAELDSEVSEGYNIGADNKVGDLNAENR